MKLENAQKIIDLLNDEECVLEWFRPYDEIKQILADKIVCQLEPPVMQKIADLRNKLTPFMSLVALLNAQESKEFSEAQHFVIDKVTANELKTINDNKLYGKVWELLKEIESNFSA